MSEGIIERKTASQRTETTYKAYFPGARWHPTPKPRGSGDKVNDVFVSIFIDIKNDEVASLPYDLSGNRQNTHCIE
jgi:hypothetical protein